MATITLSELKQRARERADMVNSKFISDPELVAYINDSASELYDLLVRTYEDYYINSTEVTITSGQDITIPVDFYKLLGLDIKEGSKWSQLERFQFNQRNIVFTNRNHFSLTCNCDRYDCF